MARRPGKGAPPGASISAKLLPLNIMGLSVGPLAASYFVDHSVVWAFRIGILGCFLAVIGYLLVFNLCRTRMTIQI